METIVRRVTGSEVAYFDLWARRGQLPDYTKLASFYLDASRAFKRTKTFS